MKEISSRIEGLRDGLFSTENSTCYERARIFTETYRELDEKPVEEKQSQALYNTFTQMPIFIREGELIVGQRASRLGASILYPEYNLRGLDEWSAEALDFWQNRTLGYHTRKRHSAELRLAESELAAGYATGTDTGYGHVIADYELVLRHGLNSLIDKAEEHAQRSTEAKDFYDSVSRTCRGVIAWAERYAELAEREARSAETTRAAELNEIARICRKVPAEPAETFHEALQSFWFIHIALHIEQHGWSISAGRFDQYMYPYFAKMTDTGHADELIMSLWVKFMENVGSSIRATTFQNLTLGGVRADGSDACNGLTVACLGATAALGMNQPALSFRWHPDIDEHAWRTAIETISRGSGMPALFNDNTIVPALKAKGVADGDAMGYGIVGCVEASVPGKEQGVTSGGHINLAKALELALNDGVSTTTGRRIGVSTGPASALTSYEDVWKAYERQIEYLCGLDIEAANVSAEEQKVHSRYPLLSSLLEGCMEKGQDLVFGSVTYRLPGVGVFGSSNVYDGLAAIKKHVFQDSALSMEELCEALRQDFEGYKRVRALLSNATPRFGNDVESVDALATTVGHVHADRFWNAANARGGHFTCGVWPVEGHVGTGRKTGATPDGRHAGTPIVDGVGACQGADRKGPTALLKSIAKLPNMDCWTAGNTANVKFTASSVHTEEGLDRLSHLLSTYMQLGGQQIQVNIVDTETLIDAQAHPEKHHDLVVRVAGFSAYFTDLSREVQDEIISRNAHEV